MSTVEKGAAAPFSFARLWWLVPCLLAMLAVLPAGDATLLPDTVRDLSDSLQLARFEAFPLVGPPIDFGPHLGPAWIWLQGIPLLVSPTLSAVAWFVAVVGALKLVLLAGIGRVWGGPRLALCVALAAALPSIAVFQWMVFFHPNWVEVAIALALLLALVAARRRSMRWWYASAFALGLAVQMHPTAIFYAPALAVALVPIRARGRIWILHGVGAMLAIAVWFVPILIDEEIDEPTGAARSAVLVRHGLQAFNLGDLATVVRTAYVDLPWAIGETYAPFAGVAPAAWHALLVLAWIGMIGGVVVVALEGSRRSRTTLALLAIVLVLGWAIATAVRTWTSYYLGYFLLPLSALLLGGLLDEAFSARWRGLRVAAMASACAAFACTAIASIGAWRVGQQDFIDTRILALGDLQHPADVHVRARVLGAEARDDIAGFLCAQGPTVSTHGDLALAWAASLKLDLRLHCPQKVEGLVLGSTNAWTVVTRDEAAQLGRTPAKLVGNALALFHVKNAFTVPEGRPIEGDWYQFDHLRDPQPMTHVDLSFTTAPGDAVMVFEVKPFARWENVRVTRDGMPAVPMNRTYDSAVYASGPAAAKWRVEVDTNAPQWLDVHVF